MLFKVCRKYQEVFGSSLASSGKVSLQMVSTPITNYPSASPCILRILSSHCIAGIPVKLVMMTVVMQKVLTVTHYRVLHRQSCQSPQPKLQ